MKKLHEEIKNGIYAEYSTAIELFKALASDNTKVNSYINHLIIYRELEAILEELTESEREKLTEIALEFYMDSDYGALETVAIHVAEFYKDNKDNEDFSFELFRSVEPNCFLEEGNL